MKNVWNQFIIPAFESVEPNKQRTNYCVTFTLLPHKKPHCGIGARLLFSC